MNTELLAFAKLLTIISEIDMQCHYRRRLDKSNDKWQGTVTGVCETKPVTVLPGRRVVLLLKSFRV